MDYLCCAPDFMLQGTIWVGSAGQSCFFTSKLHRAELTSNLQDRYHRGRAILRSRSMVMAVDCRLCQGSSFFSIGRDENE